MIQAMLGLLGNISFISLFISLFLFWIYASFFFTFPASIPTESVQSIPASSNISDSAGLQKITDGIPDKQVFASEANRSSTQQTSANYKNLFLQFGNIGMLVSNITLFILLLLRWKESGHFPLSNLYESLIFLSWSCTLIHFGILLMHFDIKQNGVLAQWEANKEQKFIKSKNTNEITWGHRPVINKRSLVLARLTGCITSPCALFTNAFASFSLPEEMQKIAPLVPALQSNWLMMHVTVMIISYSALIIGSLLSMAFLVITQGKDIQPIKKQQAYLQDNMRNFSPVQGFYSASQLSAPTGKSSVNSDAGGANQVWLQHLNSQKPLGDFVPTRIPSVSEAGFAETLDNLSYRILGLGFPFLTIGILSGAVWANEAWGSYWSWDPKETWALLTWLVFAIYLHTRLSKGWQGKKPAIIASAGFFVIWICYLGVNLLGEGLHSYGWLVQA
jgi:cytochrome c-type biogenesis protein CcsB